MVEGKVCCLRLAGHEGHEVAERLGEVEQLAQLHADPRRVDHAHVEREELAQPVERARVVAREPHRVGPACAGRLGRVISFRPSTKSSPVRGLSTSTVHDIVPSVPVLRLLQREHRVHHRRGAFAAGKRKIACQALVQLLARASARSARRPRPREGMRLRSPCGGKGMSKASSPPLFASASSFMRSHARSLARMSIDSVLATAPRPRGCSLPLTQTSNGVRASAVLDVADEHREAVLRVLDHVGPRRVAAGRARAAPASAATTSTGAGTASPEAAVDVVLHEVLRRVARTESTEPSTLFGR